MKVLSLTLSLQQSIIKQQQNNQRLRLRLLSLSLVFTLTFFSSFFLYNALLLWLCLLLLQLSLSLFPLSISSSLVSQSSYFDQKKVIHYYYIINENPRVNLRVWVTARSHLKFLIFYQPSLSVHANSSELVVCVS